MIYKVIIDTSKKGYPESVEFHGRTLEAGHALFFKTDSDLTQEQSDFLIVNERMESENELPKYDLFGDEIIVHAIGD